MSGDALSGFKGAVIFQKIRDAGRSPGVTSDRSEKTRIAGPLANGRPGVVAVKSSSGHCRSKRINALKQRLPAPEASGRRLDGALALDSSLFPLLVSLALRGGQ